MSALLPIFPLDLVLFPGTTLPLHIFEPRYKEMISECLAQTKPFGVVRAKEGEGIAEIGCTAEIVTVTKQHPDGRMDIVTQGVRRFEVMRVVSERTFLQAEPMYFEDEPGQAASEEAAYAVKLHDEILQLARAEPQEMATDDPQLSFHLAGGLPLDLDFKQALLEMKSEPERIRAISGYLDDVLPTLRRTVHVRSKAGGNGHAM